ncbi:MAG TPA: AbrB/MazE/SpoVT family DNA-binding domain-containing protein [Candidatus Paceibacterota bacterium]|nr:AbrB/MazE/SpoVT family DNA-binding domain-containing protein [Candidatus Paceibacterota bacterium]HMO82719.1 AbrB/MazE/SpoVT family DNA-binding domain-containing protein [Candidatus Paceibacterota bacterium]
MKTKIQKWGNSLGVRLPKSITEEKSLRAGLGVSVLIKNNKIVIEPDEVDLSLKSLLSTVSIENLHTETDWTEARGNEIW